MKIIFGFTLPVLFSLSLVAQTGIGTTNPNSTLDVRGSISVSYRSFSSATTASATDNTLVFTGTSATALTLPTAATCSGRVYWIKNSSSNSSVLTIATTSSQTIDGLASWSLTQTNKAMRLVSNGANWLVVAESLPGNSGGTSWLNGGNNVTGLQNIGTTSNYDFPFITNNTEKMRLTSTGSLGIGTSNPSYMLHINASSNPLYLAGVQTGAGTDSVLTIINGLVKKVSPSAFAGSSWSLTGNGGTNPSNNFLGTTDAQAFVLKTYNAQVGRFEQNSLALGIGSTINNSTQSYALGSSAAVAYNHTNAYAIGNSAAVNTDNSFSIGNSAVTNAANSFAIGNSAAANGANDIVIGSAAVAAWNINDAIAIGPAATTNSSTSIAIGKGATTAYNLSPAIAIGNAAVVNSSNGIVMGNGATAGYIDNAVAIGNAAIVNGKNGLAAGNGAVVGYVDNATAIGAGASATNSATNSTAIGYNASATLANEIILGDRSNSNLGVGIGTENFSASNREKLLVDAGSNASSAYQNLVVGKGNTNSYVQLNIQNGNAGNGASSDVIATADNGSETSNYIDMGINSSGYSASGILGGANNAYLYTTGNDFIIGNSTNNKSLIFYTTSSNNNTERMRITSTGLIPGQDNVYTVGNSTNRWSAVWSANGTIQTSDIRLKKNIQPLIYGLKEVLKLKPVSYDWKDNSGKNKIGLIAQEVKKIIPQVVTGDETKENLGMNYAELVPVLINAVKELQQQISEMKATIGKLESGK